MSMNPFGWFGRKADKAYNDIIAQADADRKKEPYKPRSQQSKAWDWIAKRFSNNDRGSEKILLSNSQLFQMMKYMDHLEERIAALEATIAAEQQKQRVGTQARDEDQELMKLFEARLKAAKTNTCAWIVCVGQREWDLIQSSKSFMPSQYHGTGLYQGVTIYLVTDKSPNYIS